MLRKKRESPSNGDAQPVDTTKRADLNEVMTAAHARAVKFPVSRPVGYVFPAVEAFVNDVVVSLEWWAEQAYLRDRQISELMTQNDQAAFDNQRLRTEMEIFRVQGSPVVNDDGSYVTESQLGNGNNHDEGCVHAEHLESAVREVARLTSLLHRRDAMIEQLRETSGQPPTRGNRSPRRSVTQPAGPQLSGGNVTVPGNTFPRQETMTAPNQIVWGDSNPDWGTAEPAVDNEEQWGESSAPTPQWRNR
jgi:hypothetical protein